MTTRRLEGWLFDIDELGSEVVLWVYDDRGRLHRLTQPFAPAVYVGGDRSVLLRLGCELQKRGLIERFKWRRRREFWSGQWIDVLELTVIDSSLLPGLRRLAAARDREFNVYNIDIPTPQYYLYRTGLFPTCRLEAVIDESLQIQEIGALDSAYEMRRDSPRLRLMKMQGRKVQPLGAASQIILECGGEDILIRLSDEPAALRQYNAFIKRHDPDVVLSYHGDTILFPALFSIANRYRLRLAADRERFNFRRTIITEGRTFYSYGLVLYKGADYPLRGRWHIDVNNSFFHKETGIDGILELARLAKIPVQRMARQSPGTAMSSIELDYAVNHQILIHWRKSKPEKYKTALQLLTVDKGGLTYQPRIGAFEKVAEIDFASMYPTLMVRHNISPETVLCNCCDNRAVPEANYNVCEKRRGLISTVLEPLVERRRVYKEQISECGDESIRRVLGNRRAAIKWMLVSCFGYLGYKNARFGRIEAHESVTALGREKLLLAKEQIERAGFRMLHALTDSLWIQRDAPFGRRELFSLCEEISRLSRVEMSLEGVYRWIVFLPSKENDRRPVATRYYGLFDDGTMKIRGLACRRRDTPPFVKEMQLAMLEVLKGAATLAAREELRPEIEAIFNEHVRLLKSGRVAAGELLLRRTLTRNLDQYKANTRTAQAARQYQQAGIKVHPGEKVQFVISDEKTAKRTHKAKILVDDTKVKYNLDSYLKMLVDALGELGL
jgi:DNA polymerase II